MPDFSATANFRSTRWTLVIRSQDGSKRALDEFCELYWQPVFGFICRNGISEHEAQDLTQAYFANLCDRKYLEKAESSGGKLRTFLLTDLKFFLSNYRSREKAQKRGGGKAPNSVDFSEDGDWLPDDLIENRTPDHYFDFQWTIHISELALEKVRADYAARDRSNLFELIKPCLEGIDPGQYDSLAEELGKNTNYVKQQVYRLRQRFKIAFRNLIADTLNSDDDVDAEILALKEFIKSG